jgi:purine-cytosine permease-like protein
MDDESSTSAEFEREKVPDRALLGFKSFVGMYAGEHTAGTELMIGPLFVAAGVSAFDLLVGLLVGNVLAVLSWTFLTAPIATRARLTLYYQLEKICGRKLVTLYNLANGVMFCFLAGAMITVSATAVGVLVKFPMPSLTDYYPNSVGWVVASLAVGLLTAIVAVFGYAFVARVASVAAPWMTLVFIAFGLVALRQFITETHTEIHSAADLWSLASTHIWKGGDPLPGQVKFTFWHVMFFAWFCNMAMHIGMSDLSVLRFARHSWYGIASGAGMFLGHYIAWIAASLLFALQLFRTPSNTDVLPGPLAYQACGIAGLICVIIAGWTTANPTIYRAGLAFQAIMPRVSRAKVTFCTGLVAAIAGMFPAFAMKLLSFVAIYGLLLMPMGAVIFVDIYWMRKLGLQDNYAASRGIGFNWAAGLTWFLTLAACWGFVSYYGNDKIFFVGLPAWFLAAVLYVVFSKFYQQKGHA